METCFAPAERATGSDLALDLELMSSNTLITGLLKSVSGILAVVNRQRQIVAINDSFLRMLGISDPQEQMGLRLGEALQCIHAQETPSGCGTTEYCSSCGAAVAMVVCLGGHRPVERFCALTARRNGKRVDMALSVRAHPLEIEGRQYLLLFLQDVSRQQQRAALERVFFHDVNNMLAVLQGASDLLLLKEPSRLAETVRDAVLRLRREVEIQQSLAWSQEFSYQPDWRRVRADSILDELETFFARHPAAEGKTLSFSSDTPEIYLVTDTSLIQRVLGNMIINALEATPPGGKVRVWSELADKKLAFRVWNVGEMVPEAVLRIFQRNFSTKKEDGRGFGTFSMKLFGEEILRGKVKFSTSPEEGTVFSFTCPAAPPEPDVRTRS